MQKFEQETGIRVVSDVYDSNQMLDARLQVGNAGYDVDRVQRALGRPIESWFDVLDPANARKLQSYGIAIYDAADVMSAALIALGRGTSGEVPADIEDAGRVLAGARPDVRSFDSSKYVGDLANGEICAAIGHSGDVRNTRPRARLKASPSLSAEGVRALTRAWTRVKSGT